MNQRQDTFVNRRFKQVPIQTFRFIPFAPLSELATHEQKLLAGMRPHVTVQRAQVRKLLPFVARHLV